ncbi:hypothetical protein E0L36_24950 [Streptomyces sp. AJS327]|uniref:DUF6507 family protein n=1 Tax=Streptomyces sp. AJS327 TaxID=2545265 RepID=UPI0015DF107D|nr:DUF6507 family protein [Streptomyces sp. AJS327]MBA0053980.1 hypothetical protein [Streptomyces sp. AJS327]
MTGWDITPSGVAATLEETGAEARKFEGLAKTLGTTVENAAGHAGGLTQGLCTVDGGPPPQADQGQGLVAAALGEFMEAQRREIVYLVARSGKSINGAGMATMAYQRGDLSMAAEAQREALAAPDVEAILRRAAEGG